MILLPLATASCAPPSPRPHEILSELASGEDAATAALVLRDGGTPRGLTALLRGAAIETPHVDRDAATLEARIERSTWNALDAPTRAAWMQRVDLLRAEAASEVSLRFHFVREGAIWRLDLRAYDPSP